MKYRFEDLSETDVVLIGKALGKLTIDEGVALHLKMQAQIVQQEKEARAALLADAEAKAEAWRNGEREKLKQEVVASLSAPVSPQAAAPVAQ